MLIPRRVATTCCRRGLTDCRLRALDMQGHHYGEPVLKDFL